MAQVIDGKIVAAKVKSSLKEKIAKLKRKPGLAVIQVGTNPASTIYVRKKTEACKEIGIYSEMHHFEQISEKELLNLIHELNRNEKIDGILVQLPLPSEIDEKKILNSIDFAKDVDGFHPTNVGFLSTGKVGGKVGLESCTPKGIMRLLKEYKLPVSGKHAVVVGRSNIVGKPIAMMLLNASATVTICHSKTKDLKKYTKDADILIVATGKPELIKGDMIKKGAVVIDVGTSKINGKLKGDVDYESAEEVAGYITPVPGGVGPMTIAMLMENTYESSLKRQLPPHRHSNNNPNISSSNISTTRDEQK